MTSHENWAEMTDEELNIAAYEEGIQPEPIKGDADR